MNTSSSGTMTQQWASPILNCLASRPTNPILGCITLVLAVLLMSGCATTGVGPPSGEELKRIEDGERVVVLVRMTGTLNGSSYELYEAAGNPPALQYRHISVGIDGYRHGDFYGNPRFLDQNTLSEGWFYFLVQPGNHEFWFMSTFGLTNLQASFAMKHAPRYRFEVPEGVEVVYIGSFQIPVHKRGAGSKWGKIDFNPHDAEFVDESSLARDLAKKSMPELDKFVSVLMEPKEEEDMILQKPAN